MIKTQIEVGKVYLAKVSGNVVPVKVKEVKRVEYFRDMVTRYVCENLKTNRRIEIKSAAKFRREVTDARIMAIYME